MMDRHDSPADDNAVVPRFPSRPDADESNGAMWREIPERRAVMQSNRLFLSWIDDHRVDHLEGNPTRI